MEKIDSNTDINERIAGIIEDLARVLGKYKKLRWGSEDWVEAISQYRDANFLNGSQDAYFQKVIKTKKL